MQAGIVITYSEVIFTTLATKITTASDCCAQPDFFLNIKSVCEGRRPEGRALSHMWGPLPWSSSLVAYGGSGLGVGSGERNRSEASPAIESSEQVIVCIEVQGEEMTGCGRTPAPGKHQRQHHGGRRLSHIQKKSSDQTRGLQACILGTSVAGYCLGQWTKKR